MGLFSSEKIISVASTVYNMAGEEKDRPQFLESLLIQNIMSGTGESITTTTTNGLLNGPAIKLRQFFKWVRRDGHYSAVGMPTGQIATGTGLTPTDVEPYLSHPAGTEVWCQHALVGVADTSYWAEQWIMINRPGDLDTAWRSSYNRTTNQITIRFADTSTVVFTPANFDPNAYYLYAYYIIVYNPATNDVDFSSDQLYIYKIGTGNPALDALYAAGSDYGEFFPFIPIRVDNHFLGWDYHPDAYEQAINAYEKATGGSFTQLIDELAQNEDLGDIDHAYVVFGVSLNVVEMACKRYLYKFFQKLQFSQIGGPFAFGVWQAMAANQEAIYDTWRAWKVRGTTGGHDQENDPEPQRPTMSQYSKNEIRIKGSSSFDPQYDIRLQWAFITDGSGAGLGRPGARKNECWLEYMGEDATARTYYTSSNVLGADNTASYQKFRIYWQRDIDNFTYLDVVGMQHKNFIYGGESVNISSKEALEDAEESGFIVPLHYETWRETQLIDASQMGTACVFIVLNSYQVTKKKWYESGIFRIFLVIIIAIVSVLFTGGAGLGLLGAHLSVGAALGFTGMTAAIVGSIVNAMAAMLLATILQKIGAMFGVIGPVIAAVIGILIGGLVSSFQTPGSFALNWGTFLRAENLMKLTDAVGGSIQKMVAGDTASMQQEALDYTTQAAAEAKKIQEAYLQDFGYGAIVIDPTVMTQVADLMYTESTDAFLTRTLLTGSDIAEMSQDMIYNFHDYSLKLPDAFV